jgi:hypothetical protein
MEMYYYDFFETKLDKSTTTQVIVLALEQA